MPATMIDTRGTYTIEHQGRLYVIEQVPARVCEKTGREFFAADTVDHIQALIRGNTPPVRIVETPVYRYA